MTRPQTLKAPGGSQRPLVARKTGSIHGSMQGAHPFVRPTGAVLLVFLLSTVGVGASSPVMMEPEDWAFELDDLRAPYNEASAITAMVLSSDGRIIVFGTDNGAVLFVDARTGALLDGGSAHTPSHGAVKTIHLDEGATLAALVYESGYVAVVSRVEDAPLYTRYSDQGAPEKERPRIGAVLSPDGRFLVVTGDVVRLFHRASGPDPAFKEVSNDATGLGPYVWFHSSYPIFGVLSAEGDVTIYSYTNGGMRAEGTRDLTDDGTIEALAVSGDGDRFGILLDTGDLIRYTPSLDPQEPRLIPDFRDKIKGPPLGVRLDMTGDRIAAWSQDELLWAEGCNLNQEICTSGDADRDLVHLRPPLGTHIATAAVTPDLDRAVLQVEGEGRERRVYNLPSLEQFTLASDEVATGLSLLSPDGTKVYQADGPVLAVREITPEELPPPQRSDDSMDEDGDAPTPFGLSSSRILVGGIGALVLLVLVILGSLLLASRRHRPAPTPLPTLAPLEEEAMRSFTPMAIPSSAAPPGRIRHVVPSAPSVQAAPDGLLTLADVAVDGPVLLKGLQLVVKRPEVLRIHGERAVLETFSDLLGGAFPFTGILAVGGASARETPVLFQRRVRIGLDEASTNGADPATVFRAVARSRGLPVGLVERRLEKDLGWMGERRDHPWERLRPFDRWKVRVALALVDRPHLLVLWVRDVPGGPEGRSAVVRKVLSGVARHYETLVVLLDDGSADPVWVRRLADEEMRLAPSGFTDRHLLLEGRPAEPRGDTPGKRSTKAVRRR